MGKLHIQQMIQATIALRTQRICKYTLLHRGYQLLYGCLISKDLQLAKCAIELAVELPDADQFIVPSS